MNTVCREPARINVKAVVILLLVVVVLLGGAVVGYKVRKRIVANRELAAGREALAREDWPAACKHLKLYLSKYPDDEEILERYAEANLAVRPVEQKNLGQAIAAYRRLLRRHPGDDRLSAELAELYIRSGNFTEAAYVCRQRLEAEPGDPDARLALGRVLHFQREFAEAREVLTALVEQHPGEVEAWWLLSSVALSDDPPRRDEALRLLDEAVRANPKSAEALVYRAQAHLTEPRDAEAARADIQAAGALGTSDPNALLLVAKMQLTLGDIDRSRATLQRVEQLDADTLAAHDVDPDDLALQTFMGSGTAALFGGDAEEGAAIADRALAELSGRHRTAFFPLAVELYVAANRATQARQCLEDFRADIEEAGPLTTERSDALDLLDAVIATAEDRPYHAINRLEPLLIRKPNNTRALRMLAAAYEATGQWPRVIEVETQYLDLSPQDLAATLRLARAHRRIGDLAGAVRVAREAESLDPENRYARILRIESEIDAVEAGTIPAAQLARLSRELATWPATAVQAEQVPILQARIAALEQRDREAIVTLEEQLANGENGFAAAFHLIRQYIETGQVDKAVEACRRAAADRPEWAAPRLFLAQLLADNDRVDEARATLDQAVAELTGEERLRARVFLAEFLMGHDQRPEGVALLRSLAASHPDEPRLRSVLLMLPEVQRDPREAQRLVDDLRRIEGERGLRWRFEQARLWLLSPDWQERRPQIEESLSHCVAANPSWSEPVLVLGRMYERLDDRARAEEVYRQAIDANPNQLDVAIQLLTLLQGQNRFADAAALLERMPGNAVVLSPHRVGVAIGRGEFDTAIGELQRRVAADPADAASRVALARLLHGHRKDAAAALRLLDEVEMLSPDLFPALSLRAEILFAEDRREEALVLLNEAVDRRQDFLAYWLRAQYYNYGTDEAALAEQDYTRLTTFEEAAGDGHALLGNFYLTRGRAEEAIRTWEAGLTRDPGHAGIQRALTRALVRSDDPQRRQEGRARLERLLEQLPDDPGLLATRAAVLLEEATPESTTQARDLLERVVQLDPRYVAAHLQLIELAGQAGQPAETERLLTRALGANPGNADLTLAQAAFEARRGNRRLATELARSVLAARDDNLAARGLLIDLALQGGDTDQAGPLIDELLAADPHNEAAHIARAEVLARTGQRAEAIRTLEAYRQTDAGRGKLASLVVLAELHRKEGAVEAAGKCIKEAERLAPENGAVFLERLRWLAGQGRFADIPDLLAARRRQQQTEPAVMLDAAWLLAAGGEERHLRQARSLFEEVVSLTPDVIAARVGLAQVAYLLGEIDFSEQTYRRVLAQEPYHRQGLNDLAWIIGVDRGRPEEGLEFADRGLGRYPADVHLLDTRGVLLTRLGRLDDARRDLENCLRVAGDIPATRANALLHLGQVLVRQGSYDTARERLDEARRIHAEHAVFDPQQQAELERLLAGSASGGGTP